MNDAKRDLALAILLVGCACYMVGYTQASKAKLVKSDSATLIEGLCIDVLNSKKESVEP